MTSRYPTAPVVGVGVCLLRPGEVLLVRRGKPPSQGSWSLPGGRQELGETAAEGARRELREEAGVEAEALHLVANVDSIHRDPDGRIQYHYTIVDFAARWRSGTPTPGDDVSEAIWAPLDALEPYRLWTEALRVIELSRKLLAL